MFHVTFIEVCYTSSEKLCFDQTFKKVYLVDFWCSAKTTNFLTKFFLFGNRHSFLAKKEIRNKFLIECKFSNNLNTALKISQY